MKNVTASIRDRLLQVARQKGIQFQRVLTLYKQEGLLHRIVSTDLAESIVLKGGLLDPRRSRQYPAPNTLIRSSGIV